MSADGRIGLVLFVKDEVYDIAAWLAWHLAVGFDTIFVFDDASGDGTRHVVQSAAEAFDVRCSQAERSHDFFYDRQQHAYRQILAAAKDEFAWLCFLDGDEYLLLVKDDTVRDFLARHPDADAVAVNWRMHGTGGRLLRPLVPPPAAYPMHSAAQEPINRHVKSFVRPDRLQAGWVNVHCFPVDASRYLDPQGAPVVWTDHGGITRDAPSFETAAVMHFVGRSMEHFLERVRKRSDTPVDLRTWLHESWHVEQTRTADRFFDRMYEALARIETQANTFLCECIRSLASSLPDGSQALAWPGSGPVRYFEVATHFGTRLHVWTPGGMLVHCHPGPNDALAPVYAAGRPGELADVLLVPATFAFAPLRLPGDRQCMVLPDLRLSAAPEGSQTLRSPSTGFFMTTEPPAADIPGTIRFNQREAKEWEQLRLDETDGAVIPAGVDAALNGYFSLLAAGVTLEGLSRFVSSQPAELTPLLIQPLLRRMSKPEKTRLSAHLAAAATPELIAGSQYS